MASLILNLTPLWNESKGHKINMTLNDFGYTGEMLKTKLLGEEKEKQESQEKLAHGKLKKETNLNEDFIDFGKMIVDEVNRYKAKIRKNIYENSIIAINWRNKGRR